MRRVRYLAPYIGQQVEAKIIELDKNRNNVVLSRRAWLEQTQSAVRHDFLQTLQKGQSPPGAWSSTATSAPSAVPVVFGGPVPAPNLPRNTTINREKVVPSAARSTVVCPD